MSFLVISLFRRVMDLDIGSYSRTWSLVEAYMSVIRCKSSPNGLRIVRAVAILKQANRVGELPEELSGKQTCALVSRKKTR